MGRCLAAVVASLLVGGAAPAAWADGALPDAQNILTPVDRPLEILLPTNFGVVFSRDGGATWLWTCEQPANALGWLYQVGLPPRHRVFTLANGTLAYSDDLTCGWHLAGGAAIAGQELADAWVDRHVPDRVLAIGVHCCSGTDNIYSVFESRDGGATFGTMLYQAAPGDSISGIESALTAPGTIYLTMAVGASYRPTVARTSDGGATWMLHDLSPSLRAGKLRLLAVDPTAPQRLYLLWNDPANGQAVAVSEDGGATASIRLIPAPSGAVVKGFGRAASGAVLVATDAGGTSALYRSRDTGTTFETVPNPPHVRGFSQRGALVYAATDNFADGYALATSPDDGTTWTPLMSYDNVRAIAGCVKDSCQAMCTAQADVLWPAGVCTASAEPAPVTSPPPSPGGNGCSLAPASPPANGGPDRATPLLLLGLAALGLRPRRGC